MAHWFEDLTKTVADEKIGRRTAVRRIGGTVVGVALSSAIPGLALANKIEKKNCGRPGNCSIGFKHCGNKINPYKNCYCFTDINGKGKCGCDITCSGVSPCNMDSQCSKGSFCTGLNGCTGCGGSFGMCIPYCNSTCKIGSHAGPTAAGSKF